MLWLDDLSNEGHIPAIYHDDPGDRIVFFRKNVEDRRRWSAVAAELGCVPAMRGLESMGDGSDDREPWGGEVMSDGRKTAVACLCA
jgi:hypothetical protein